MGKENNDIVIWVISRVDQDSTVIMGWQENGSNYGDANISNKQLLKIFSIKIHPVTSSLANCKRKTSAAHLTNSLPRPKTQIHHNCLLRAHLYFDGVQGAHLK